MVITILKILNVLQCCPAQMFLFEYGIGTYSNSFFSGVQYCDLGPQLFESLRTFYARGRLWNFHYFFDRL